MASNIYGAIALTGGTTGALDSIKYAVINDGDMCIAIVGGATDTAYIYTYDSASAAAESSPDVIKPDDAGAGNGRWILCDLRVADLVTTLSLTVTTTLGVTGATTLTGLLTANGGITLGDSQNITIDNAPAADTSHSGIITSLTAGEILAYGDFCYLKSDGKMWKADADASTTMPIVAMAAAAISADAAGNFLMMGFVRDDSWNWTVGGVLYASTTSAGLTQTAPSGSGDQVQTVGIATHADRIWFFPNFSLVEIT